LLRKQLQNLKSYCEISIMFNLNRRRARDVPTSEHSTPPRLAPGQSLTPMQTSQSSQTKGKADFVE